MLELSRNPVTVRVAQQVGMKKVVEVAKEFGVTDNMHPIFRWRWVPARRPCCA